MDTMICTVTSPDEGIFALAMLRPGTEGLAEDYFQTEDMIAGCTADEFKSKINGFYT